MKIDKNRQGSGNKRKETHMAGDENSVAHDELKFKLGVTGSKF